MNAGWSGVPAVPDLVAAAIGVAVLASVATSALARTSARRLPPAVAVVGLTAAAVCCAGATVAALAVLCFPVLGELDVVAALGRWRAAAPARALPLPGGTSPASVTVAAVLGVALVVHLVHSWRQARAVRHVLGAVAPAASLVVLDSGVPLAFAAPGRPGRPGRVVVSRDLLQRLSPIERRALLAHERAHLQLRHHLAVRLSRCAAAVDPLLRPVLGAVHGGVERWADDSAARVVGDRAAVARAIAAAALAAAEPAPGTSSVLGALGSDTVARVRELLAPPRPASRWGAALLAAPSVAAIGAGSALALLLHHVVELAQSLP